MIPGAHLMRLLVRAGRPLRRAGFSLMEMLVVVAVTGILATMAAPALISTLDSNRRATLSSRLMSDLALARSKALVLGKSVALCGWNGSENAPACSGKTGSGAATKSDWSKGWYMYLGSNATVGTVVIRKPEAVPSGWVVDAHLGVMNYSAFNARSDATGIGHFTIYRSGATTAACVTLSGTGRARASTASVSTGTVSASNDPC